MIKLLAGEGLFCLLRGEQQHHRDIHKHLFGEPVQKFPDFWLALEAVHTLKVRVNNPEANGHWIVPTSLNLRVRVDVFILRKYVKDLLDLYVRSVTAISLCHHYNRLSAHVRISVAESTKACASRTAIVPGAYRMSVD